MCGQCTNVSLFIVKMFIRLSKDGTQVDDQKLLLVRAMYFSMYVSTRCMDIQKLSVQ